MKDIKVLDPKGFHARLMEDVANVSSIAGVQPRFLSESMTKHCSATEVDWVSQFYAYQKQGVPGLVLEGVANPDSRCQAIAAALLRNYIDARVIPLGTLLDQQKEGLSVNPTVLLIPNMFVSMSDKGIPAWRMQGLYDLLLHRAVNSKPSVLYVQDYEKLKTTFGVPLANFLSGFQWVRE